MANQLNQVLVVEDVTAIRSVINAHIKTAGDFVVVEAETQAQALDCIAKSRVPFLCAVSDLCLPDSPNGEVVSSIQEHNIPVIVLSGRSDAEKQQMLNLSWVVESVGKESLDNIQYVAQLVKGIYDNQTTDVLVVDDSKSFNQYVSLLLANYRYRVHQAFDGVDALEKIETIGSVKLVITDYNMPKMDGLGLIAEIRSTRPREELVVLGLSAVGDKELAAKLLKAGANDYMSKPFLAEEFYCRVSQSINMVRYTEKIKRNATHDYLTQVNNRYSLFDIGNVLYANAKRNTVNIAVGMIDADHFKQVNDTYGHDIGDKVLVAIATTIKQQLRDSDVLARFGGEEFVCVACIRNEKDAALIFERVRQAIASIEIPVDDAVVRPTVSIGFTTNLGSSLNAMIKQADEGVYQAKEAGRNCIRLVE